MQEMNSLDFIKKTMQIHEDIFKCQVRELHRLYSVQKILMEELKKEIKQKKTYWNLMNDSETDNSDKFVARHQNDSTAQKSNFRNNFNLQNLTDDPSSRQGSGGYSGETIQIMAKGLDLVRPADLEDRSRLSSCCESLTGSKMSRNENSDEESEVELTLSIGGSSKTSSRKTSKKSENQPPLMQQEDEQEIRKSATINGLFSSIQRRRWELQWANNASELL